MSSSKHTSCIGRIRSVIARFMRLLGPGFITGAADDDPSGIATYSLAGAKYGLLCLWFLPFQLPLMYSIQHMCARIGLVTGKGLAANFKAHLPRALVYTGITLLLIANTVNIGANIAMIGACIQMVCGGSTFVWAIIAVVVILIMQICISYKAYARILVWSSLVLLSYAFTALLTTNNWGRALYYTFVPHICFDSQFFFIAAGIFGTTISPYLFFWQTSQEIEAQQDDQPSKTIPAVLAQMPKDTFIGVLFSQLIAFCIMLTCAMTLHAQGMVTIHSAQDAALALKPLAGTAAYLLFAIGVIGAGFLGIPVLAGSSGYALADLFDRPAGLRFSFWQAPFFYMVIVSATLTGLAGACLAKDPVHALLYAAVINGIVAVPCIAFILILANKAVMGAYKNSFWQNLMGIIGLVSMGISLFLTIMYGLLL